MDSNSVFLTPDKNSGYMVHYLDTQLKIGLQRAFNAKGFSFTAVQFGILSLLWQKEGLHQSELARKAGKDRHNMARLLNLLEKGGYIQRKPDSIDKRRYNIFLTELGRSLQDKLTPITVDFLEKALSGLSLEDLQQLRQLHEHIISNLENLNDNYS